MTANCMILNNCLFMDWNSINVVIFQYSAREIKIYWAKHSCSLILYRINVSKLF